MVAFFAIDKALSNRELLNLNPELSAQEVIQLNKQALARAYAGLRQSSERGVTGFRQLSLMTFTKPGWSEPCSFYATSIAAQLLLVRDVAAYAEKLGYLLGPYDSYHSIHSPEAKETWETAQFDSAGYEQGRVINADGTGHGGFLGRGYHFSPKAAWPYVKQR